MPYAVINYSIGHTRIKGIFLKLRTKSDAWQLSAYNVSQAVSDLLFSVCRAAKRHH